MSGLTPRQSSMLRFVIAYVEQNGHAPSIRELGSTFGIRSLRGVTVHLEALERKGFIKRQPYVYGGILVVRNAEGVAGSFRFVEDV